MRCAKSMPDSIKTSDLNANDENNDKFSMGFSFKKGTNGFTDSNVKTSSMHPFKLGFFLEGGEATTSRGDPSTYHRYIQWTQAANPFTTSDALAASGMSNYSHDNVDVDQRAFTGLGISANQRDTWLDGTSGTDWHWAVGSYGTWIPMGNMRAQFNELYVWVGAKPNPISASL